MAKAKNTVTLINSGVAVIYIDRNRVMPGEEIEVPASLVECDGIQYSITRKELTIKDNAELNAEIVEKNIKKKKKDPTDGKTQKELEDGGEY